MLVNNVGACYNGLVINYEEGGGGGATKWENHGSETFCAPHPQDRVKLVMPPPPFEEVESCCAPLHYR